MTYIHSISQAPHRLAPHLVKPIVDIALAEDLGLAGDLTTDAIIPVTARASAVIAMRRAGVVAGLDLAKATFTAMDPTVAFTGEISDGTYAREGTIIARIDSTARAMLSAERVALNFLGRLSGIATLTHRFVSAVKGTQARVCCTRKTTPGFRALEKYAVRAGGGMNHRYGLSDAVLIKDNHIAVAGSVAAAMATVRERCGHMVKIEIEVDTLAQLAEALDHNPDAVLLDNMDVEMLVNAVKLTSGRALTEASGGVNLDTVRDVAASGVDMISIGALTHSAPNLDIGLDIDINAE